MWTYKRAYKPLLPSLDRISYHAETEFFRSLNKNRLIAFIGSGVSLSYGRLSWSELCALLIMDVDEVFWNTLNKAKDRDLSNYIIKEAMSLHSTLRIILGEDRKKEEETYQFYNNVELVKSEESEQYLPKDSKNLLSPTIDNNEVISTDTTVLELCSELASLLNKYENGDKQSCENFLKKRAAKYLTEGIVDQLGSRLKLLNGYHKNSLYDQWKTSLKDFKWAQRATFKEELKNLQESSDLKTDVFSENQWIEEVAGKKAYLRSAIEELPWKLMCNQINQSGPEDFSDLFHDLIAILSCASMKDAEIKQGDWADPLKTIIDELNIDRLVTLNYDTEIEKHFLQSKDYKKEKNDPLLIPNYQGEPERIAIRSNGFGARFTSVTLEKNLVGKLINFASASRENDSYIIHLHGRGDCADDLILTEKDYQELYVKSSTSKRAFKEGIDMLFSGNDMLFLGVGMRESDLLRPLRQFISESQNASLRHHGILALLNEEENDKDTEKQALKLHTKFGVKSMFYDPLTRDCNKELETLGNNRESMSALSYQLGLMRINRAKIGIQSYAFNEELLRLSKKQQKWWTDWRAPPGKRVAKFVDWSSQENKSLKDQPSRLWIRQKISLLANDKNTGYIKHKKQNKAFDEIIQRIEESTIVNEGDNNPALRHILRYTGSTGVGKGTLVHSLQAYCKDEMTSDKYLGCFFSDAKFSTEYTSVISALSRFLAGIIADLTWEAGYPSKEEKNTPEQVQHRLLAETEHTFDKIWVLKNLGVDLPCGKNRILQAYLNRYLECISHKKILSSEPLPRLLICLSGLERLVDKNGYAYNALHRDFFKLLIKPKNNVIPLTIVLIADNPETPIRYLSKIHADNKIDKKGFDVSWDSQKARLQPWKTIYKTDIKDRHWLPNCEINKSRAPVAISNNCDKRLGIYHDYPEEIQRKCLAKVAYDYISVHLWLRILLKKIQPKEKSSKKEQEPIRRKEIEILDSLELAASRSGVYGAVDKLLDIYEKIDTNPEALRLVTGYQTILRHLSLFSISVERAVLVNCPEVITAIYGDSPIPNSEREKAEKIEGYLQTLNEIGLIIKIERSGSIGAIKPDDEENYRYTLASIMRKHFAQRMDFDAYVHGEFSFFDVSLYPTQPLDLPSPKERDFLFIGKILQNIISNARHNLHNIESDDLDSIHSLSRTIRAAVNLVNGSFSIGVVSRLENSELNHIEYVCGHAQPFEAYNRWLRCLSNIAVAIDKKEQELNKGAQHTEEKQKQVRKIYIQKPLYETEAAWIYNEQALVNLIQGRLFDADKLFSMAKERLDSTPWVDPDDTHSYPSLTSLRRVELNHAITLLEMGQIKEAESEFVRLYRRAKNNKRNNTSLTVHLACGYLGLCYHLQGRMTQAEERYKEALTFFKQENKNYLRVTAIFRLHYGNLKRALKDYENADLFLSIAIGAAASAKQMDIFHYASVSRAKLLLTRAKKGYAYEAMSILDNAREYAEKMGVFKLQVHADITRGEILMAQKQNTAAGKLLANAIAISNKHGMRLMKLRALQVYAKALEKRGTDKRVTDEILHTAKYLSENTGYLIKWVNEE